MTFWGKGINVNDIRTIPASDREFFSQPWHKIHGSFRISKEDWEALEPGDRQKLRAKAVGRQVQTAILVGRAAGELWGLWVLGADYDIELSYPSNGKPPPKRQWLPGVRYRQMHIPREDWIEQKGVRLSTLTRTVIDICRLESFPHGLAAIESYLRAGHSKSRLIEHFHKIGNLKGKKKFLRALKWAGTSSRSASESLAKAQMIEAGVKMAKIKQNPRMYIKGEKYFPDFLYDGWLAIEVNGEVKYRGKYGDPVKRMRTERKKEEDFLNAGYSRLSVGWQELVTGEFIQLFREHVANRR